jgi:hypothetical protein
MDGELKCVNEALTEKSWENEAQKPKSATEAAMREPTRLGNAILS